MENSPLLVGIGGAGCSIAEQVHAIAGGSLVRVNAAEDIRPAWPSGSTVALPVPPRGRRVAQDAARSAEAQRGRLDELFRGIPQLVLFSGLGGAIGSGATPVIARLAAQSGCRVAVFATLPFALETGATPVARMSLAEIRAVCPEVCIHDHDAAIRDTAHADAGMNALLVLSARAAASYSRNLTM